MRVVVLGAGLVGGPMAVDLAADERFAVTAVDIDGGALAKLSARGIAVRQQDLREAESVRSLVDEFDLVLNAVPGFMGFATLQAIVSAGKDVVDIAFFPEDPFQLQDLARQKGVRAIVDCGVAPGMSNLLVGHADQLLDQTETVLIYVGGLPVKRSWPYEYKAVFSPADVIEEYTRPARYVENGVLIVRPALSDPELIDFPHVGTLEAFNTDGLRTLAETIDAPNKKEKTLRYPGHIEKMAVLRATGFFDQEEIEIGGARIRPLDFTSRLLFPQWKLEEGEADLTIMRVLVEGRHGECRRRYIYDLLDRYDELRAVHSMARTTGYTATMALRLLAQGLVREEGIIVPEWLGRHADCVDFMLRGLRERGIVYAKKVENLGGESLLGG